MVLLCHKLTMNFLIETKYIDSMKRRIGEINNWIFTFNIKCLIKNSQSRKMKLGYSIIVPIKRCDGIKR